MSCLATPPPHISADGVAATPDELAIFSFPEEVRSEAFGHAPSLENR